MAPHVLDIRLMGGEHNSKKAFVPHISISPSVEQIAFVDNPICLTFSMTINKSQGQLVDHIGLDLRTNVFAHGQLYVALSRCTSGCHVKALLRMMLIGPQKNIVYPEVLFD
jgi:hypothetical protein